MTAIRKSPALSLNLKKIPKLSKHFHVPDTFESHKTLERITSFLNGVETGTDTQRSTLGVSYTHQ